MDTVFQNSALMQTVLLSGRGEGNVGAHDRSDQDSAGLTPLMLTSSVYAGSLATCTPPFMLTILVLMAAGQRRGVDSCASHCSRSGEHLFLALLCVLHFHFVPELSFFLHLSGFLVPLPFSRCSSCTLLFPSSRLSYLASPFPPLSIIPALRAFCQISLHLRYALSGAYIPLQLASIDRQLLVITASTEQSWYKTPLFAYA